jgi:PHP family Zn ribbon phosphoesterase
MTLESSPAAYLVPAHVWTPWFSVLGSKSGFDAVQDYGRGLRSCGAPLTLGVLHRVEELADPQTGADRGHRAQRFVAARRGHHAHARR